MTREQKALAAYGSVLGATLVLWLTWSVPGAILFLVLAGAAVTAVLRLTRPHLGGGRPPARTGLPRPPTRAQAPGRPRPPLGRAPGR